MVNNNIVLLLFTGVGATLNFGNILKELSQEVCADWEDIGLILKLPQGRLKAIKCDHPSNASKCFREMIKLWLDQTNPCPSWASVIEAIDILQHESLAEQLRKKFL
jgi:hypothetical protein